MTVCSRNRSSRSWSSARVKELLEHSRGRIAAQVLAGPAPSSAPGPERTAPRPPVRGDGRVSRVRVARRLFRQARCRVRQPAQRAAGDAGLGEWRRQRGAGEPAGGLTGPLGPRAIAPAATTQGGRYLGHRTAVHAGHRAALVSRANPRPAVLCSAPRDRASPAARSRAARHGGPAGLDTELRAPETPAMPALAEAFADAARRRTARRGARECRDVGAASDRDGRPRRASGAARARAPLGSRRARDHGAELVSVRLPNDWFAKRSTASRPRSRTCNTIAGCHHRRCR